MVEGTDYYVSLSGDDGTSLGSPWRSIGRVNNKFFFDLLGLFIFFF